MRRQRLQISCYKLSQLASILATSAFEAGGGLLGAAEVRSWGCCCLAAGALPLSRLLEGDEDSAEGREAWVGGDGTRGPVPESWREQSRGGGGGMQRRAVVDCYYYSDERSLLLGRAGTSKVDGDGPYS